MTRLGVVAVAALLLFTFSRCAPTGAASLELTAKPTAIDEHGQVTELTATATGKDGKPGRGAVKFTSVGGSLSQSETATLDADGKASVGFSCDVAADARCTGKVRVVAEWVVEGETVGAERRVPVGPQVPVITVDAVFDDDGGFSMTPCMGATPGTTSCFADGGCSRGFVCLGQRCELKGSGGPLQMTLRFDQPEDLDLHVVEPGFSGMPCEVWYGNTNRGFAGGCGGGSLDLDSNAGCDIDNVDTENLIYPAVYPHVGQYVVRVDYYQTCKATGPVPYQLAVRTNAEVRYWCGSFMPGDSDHGAAGSGRTLASFTVR